MLLQMWTRNIAALFSSEEFLQLGKASINQQLKLVLVAPLACKRKWETLSQDVPWICEEELHHLLLQLQWLWDKVWFWGFLHETFGAMGVVWWITLAQSSFRSLQSTEANPARARGVERTHKKSANSVQHTSRSWAQKVNARVKSGTAILFNAKPLDRQTAPTRGYLFLPVDSMW